MKQISVSLPNRPGTLYNVCDVLAKSGVNILSLYAEQTNYNDKSGVVRMAVHDENAATRALKLGGFKYDVKDLHVVELPDKPGELAKATHKLAHKGVNIDNLFILGSGKGTTRIALTTNDIEKTRQALSM
ncbi:MAG: ACT domain-containing protein [DPANN group archaeon]|nr:ACT domain-containing protein [DPANN group archaeon]